MKIKHLFVSILLATGFQPMIAQSALRQQFVNSSVQEARPWTFWYWMFGAVTPEGITADLEAMHRVGLGCPSREWSRDLNTKEKLNNLPPNGGVWSLIV